MTYASIDHACLRYVCGKWPLNQMEPQMVTIIQKACTSDDYCRLVKRNVEVLRQVLFITFLKFQ